MGLRLKFNLVLVAVFLFGVAVSGVVSYTLLHKHAREEVLNTAGVMMEAAKAIRSYTVEQVKPHLEAQLAETFLPQSVPAYAATETLNELRRNHPSYAYKEATLNPTNPRNRAADWEEDIIRAFRDRAAAAPAPDAPLGEIAGVRDTPTGPVVYLARPVRIGNGACLACHSTPEAAPPSLLKVYGSANGFGWKLHEVIGAQVVSVPMELPVGKANEAFATFMGSLVAVFLGAMLALNLILGRLILRPISSMSVAADKVSTGDFKVPEFREQGRDEMSVLASSFNRLRRSLERAMQMLEG